MNTLRCPRCNQELSEDISICAHCGESTTATEYIPVHTEQIVSTSMDLENDTLVLPKEILSEFHAVSQDGNGTFFANKDSAKQRAFFDDPYDDYIEPGRYIAGESVEDTRSRPLTWHKDVEPISDHSMLVLPPRPRPDSMFFKKRWHRAAPTLVVWCSLLVLVALVVSGIFGIFVTLGKDNGIGGARKGPLSLEVTPDNVSDDSTITLRGKHFTPGGEVGLSRDASLPLVDTSGQTLIRADSNGNFEDTINLDHDWGGGPHIVNAEDAVTHKMVSYPIMVSAPGGSVRPARLRLSVDSLDLGAGDPTVNTTRTIKLMNGGSGLITWQGSSNQPWLLLTPKKGTFTSTHDAEVKIAVDRSKLRVGSYNAQIVFASSAGTITLPVKMKVTTLEAVHVPILQLTPALLTFNGVDGGPAPQSQVVTVSNPGALPLHWGVASSTSWLSVSPSSGTVSPGDQQVLSIKVNTSTLLPGTYTAEMFFSTDDADHARNSPQSVSISVTITPQCSIQLSPGMLSFASTYLATPAPKIVGLSAATGCNVPIRWSAISSARWLTISASSGTTPASPVVSINSTGMSPGTYQGSITFLTDQGVQTLGVTFTMSVAVTPLVSTTPSSMTFSGVSGQMSPATGQIITLTNSGNAPMNWNATAATTSGGSWLSMTPTTGVLPAQQSVQLMVNTTLLSTLIPGTYTGSVTIYGTDATGKPAAGGVQVIPISLVVSAPCTVIVSPSVLSFTAVSGQATPPAAQTVAILASGACPNTIAWSTAVSTTPAGGAWLTTSATSGTVTPTTSATMNINTPPGTLAMGTYTGVVTVNAVDSVTRAVIGTPQSVNVTLNVQQACTLLAPSTTALTFNTTSGGSPAPQSFTIGSAGICNGGVTLTPSVALSNGSGWLSVSSSATTITNTTGATITASVSTAGLGAGTYTGTITLDAVNGGVAIVNSGQKVAVTLTVTAPPSLSTGPASITINVTTGTATQPITINNTGGQSMNWSAALAQGAPSFVSLSSTSGSLAGGNNTTINVNVDATGVQGGNSYSTSVIVSAIDPATGNAVAGSPVKIPVTINVAAPAMQVSTTSLAFTTQVGTNPAADTLTVTNTGGDTLSWTIGAPTQSWLSVTPTSGSDASQVSSTVNVAVDVTGIAPGQYSATFTITPSAGNPATVTVTLTVQ